MDTSESGWQGEGWLRTRALGRGVWAIDDNGQDTIYLVEGAERALLVDTGWGVGDLPGLVARLTDLPLVVANTHGHPDHACGNGAFATVHIHEADLSFVREPLSESTRQWIERFLLPRPRPEGFSLETWATSVAGSLVPIAGGHAFDLGGRVLEAISLPGHSPGSICLLDRQQRRLYSGDSLLAGTLWLHLEESTPLSEYHRNLLRLRELAGEFDEILPAHGELPLPTRLLEELIAGVEGVLEGRRVGTEEKTFAGDGLRCDFGSCALLYRPDRL